MRAGSKTATLALLLLLLGASVAAGRPGQLDGSFGHHGTGGGGLGAHFQQTYFYSVEEAPNGSILAGRDELLRRFSPSGDFKGRSHDSYVEPAPVRVVGADGKILEASHGSQVKRLNPDGTVDTSFNGGETKELGFYVQALQLLPSGEVMAAGRMVYEPLIHGFIWQVGMALIDSNGSLDPGFGGDGKVELRRDDGVRGEELLGLAGRPGGAVVVGTDFVLAVGADGALDQAYGSAGFAPLGKSSILAFDPGPGGRVAVAGSTGSLECCTLKPSRHFFVAHLDPSGKPDPAYSGGKGIAVVGGVEDRAQTALFAPDGAVTLAGSTTVPGGTICLRLVRCDESMPALARFDAAGMPDAGFGQGGLVRIAALAGVGGEAGAPDLAERRGGGFLVAGGGGPLASLAFLAALEPDGSPDRRFADDGLLTERAPEHSSVEVEAAGTAPGGKVLVGAWSNVGVFSGPLLVRYGRDGRIDRGFGAGAGYVRLGLEGEILGMAVDARGGSVVLTDKATIVGVTPRGALSTLFKRRLVPSGSKAQFRDVAIQPDGKIVLAGTDQGHRAGHANMLVARLLPSGQLDRGFGDGGYAEVRCPPHGRCRARKILLQRDGRILLAGRMTGSRFPPSGELKSRAAVARLHADGQPDRSFGGDGFVSLRITRESAIADLTRSGGRIFVAGSALPSRGKAHGFLAALAEDGRLDRGFGRGGVTRALPRWTSPVQVLATDGRLIVLNESRSPAVLAFHLDGSADHRFARAATRRLVQRYSSRAMTAQDGQVILAWSQSIRRTKYRPGYSQLRLARLTF
jgi:uncharacterized delta-60 repeat protein